MKAGGCAKVLRRGSVAGEEVERGGELLFPRRFGGHAGDVGAFDHHQFGAGDGAGDELALGEGVGDTVAGVDDERGDGDAVEAVLGIEPVDDAAAFAQGSEVLLVEKRDAVFRAVANDNPALAGQTGGV